MDTHRRSWQQLGVLTTIYSVHFYLFDRFELPVPELSNHVENRWWTIVDDIADFLLDEFQKTALSVFSNDERNARNRGYEDFSDSLFFQIGDTLDPILTNQKPTVQTDLVLYFLMRVIQHASSIFIELLKSDPNNAAWKAAFASKYIDLEIIREREFNVFAGSSARNAFYPAEIVALQVGFLCEFLIVNNDKADLFLLLERD